MTTTRPRLRVLSYNIRFGLGIDRRIDLERITEVIATFDPHIVALQEVDIRRTRSGGIDQAAMIAARLGMPPYFGASFERGTERYGNMTLTRLHHVATRHLRLPWEAHRWRAEPRCALVTRLEWPARGVEFDMVNTHLSTSSRERPAQVTALLGGLPGEEVIIAGDFNCTPRSAPYRMLCNGMRSATGGARTFPALLPLVPIDHILFRGPLDAVRGGRWTEGPVRRASDHLPVFAELEYTGGTDAS